MVLFKAYQHKAIYFLEQFVQIAQNLLVYCKIGRGVPKKSLTWADLALEVETLLVNCREMLVSMLTDASIDLFIYLVSIYPMLDASC